MLCDLIHFVLIFGLLAEFMNMKSLKIPLKQERYFIKAWDQIATLNNYGVSI